MNETDFAAGPAPALAESPSSVFDASPTHRKETVRAVVAMLYYQGYTLAILGIAAPWIAKTFKLDQSGIAEMFAWVSLNVFGALVLARMADRVGRRRVLLWSLIATPLFSIGAALATTPFWFIVFEIGAYAFIGATFASAIVILAEALPVEKRAEGQSYAGLARSLGGGICIIAMPILARYGWSWRWLLLLPIAGIAFLPLMARIPESLRWEDVAARGVAARSHIYDVFRGVYRRRAIPLIIAVLFGETAAVAATSWPYYHAITVVGLSPAKTSTMLLVAGGVGLVGFPVGAWCAEHLGRPRSVLYLSLASIIGALGFYWGPPAHYAYPTLWLGGCYLWFSMLGNATIVSANSAITELFPTALRSTFIGWLTLVVAISAVIAQATIAALAKPMGGLSIVVGYLILLSIPSSLIWGIFVDETQGLDLEAAAHEEAQS